MADAGEQPTSPRIQVQPVPTVVGLGQSEFPGPVPDPDNEGEMKMGLVRHLVLSFSTPQGENHFFLSPDQAKNLGATLEQAAAATQSGVWLPGQGD